MAIVSLKKASARLGVPHTIIEGWVKRGLVQIQRNAPADASTESEQYVDEDQLSEVAESLGWLHLAADQWDGPEDQ